MPRLTFSSASQRNPDRDGLDIMYMYTMPGSNEVFGILASGATNSWNMTDQEKSDYAQILFTSVIAYIKQCWSETGELPERNVEIYENRHFYAGNKKTSWVNYVLDLN